MIIHVFFPSPLGGGTYLYLYLSFLSFFIFIFYKMYLGGKSPIIVRRDRNLISKKNKKTGGTYTEVCRT